MKWFCTLYLGQQPFAVSPDVHVCVCSIGSPQSSALGHATAAVEVPTAAAEAEEVHSQPLTPSQGETFRRRDPDFPDFQLANGKHESQ